MRLSGSSYFIMVIMAAVLAMIVLSLRLEYLESKLLPMTIGGIVLALAVVALGKELSAQGKSRATATGDVEAVRREAKVRLGRFLIAGAWVLGFFLGIYLLGFIITVPLLILSFMKSHGIGWRATIIFTVATPVLIYVIFELVLGVELYRGLLLAR